MKKFVMMLMLAVFSLGASLCADAARTICRGI